MSILSDDDYINLFAKEYEQVPQISPDEAVCRAGRAIEAAVLEAQGKQEPVAWCVAYDDPRMGRIHSNPTMCEPEVDAHVSKCGGVVVKVPLFAAPVVQPGMVITVDWLSNVIRSVDGSNTLGAGALAEKIVEAIAAAEGKK